MENNKKLLSLEETAQLLKTTKVNVLMHARKGLLEQIEEEGQWYITTRSFTAFVSDNGSKNSDTLCSSGCAHATSCGSNCS